MPASFLTVFETSRLILNELKSTIPINNGNTAPFVNCDCNTLKQISFMIARYVTGPNIAYQSKLIKCLSDLNIYSLSIPTSIIYIIVKSFLFGIKWRNLHKINCAKTKANKCNSNSYFDFNSSIIRYPYETSFSINLSEYHNQNYSFIFHINITNKSNQCWIGLINKMNDNNIYLNKNIGLIYYGGCEKNIARAQAAAVNHKNDANLDINLLQKLIHRNFAINNKYQIENALMEYLNRDGYGAIYLNGKNIKYQLKSFTSGDWISIILENNTIYFYKNAELIYNKIDLNLLNQNTAINNDLILFSFLDKNDEIYVEQAYSKNGLING